MVSVQRQRLWNQYEHEFLFYRYIIEKSDRNPALISKLYDYILFSKNLLLSSDIQKNNGDDTQLMIKW